MNRCTAFLDNYAFLFHLLFSVAPAAGKIEETRFFVALHATGVCFVSFLFYVTQVFSFSNLAPMIKWLVPLARKCSVTSSVLADAINHNAFNCENK